MKTRTAPSSASTVPSSSSSRSSFSERPASRTAPDCLRNCAGWLQICLSPVSSASTSPRRAWSSVGALDPVHGVADERLVEHHLLAGQAERVVGLGLGRQLRARCRGRTCGGAAGTARSGRRTAGPWSARTPDSIGAAHTLRKALRLPSSPGVAQSRIAQSSVRLFSTGVPVSATRAALGIARSARAVEDRAFLTCCASSATTRSHADLGQRLVVAPHRAVRRQHEPVGSSSSDAPAAVEAADRRRRARTGAISASQLPSRLAGQTTSVGPVAGRGVAPGAGAARSA